MLVAVEEGKEIPKCWKLSVLWKELQGYDDKEEGVRRLLEYLENVMMGEEYISACGSEERINLISQFPALQNTLPSTLISSLHSS
jgi:HEPN domain-containing protein